MTAVTPWMSDSGRRSGTGWARLRVPSGWLLLAVTAVHNSDLHMLAAIGGYLRYLGPACFVLESAPSTPEDAVAQSLIAWPRGTTPLIAEGEVAGLQVPGFGDLPLGSWVGAGGGGREAPLPPLPDECPSDRVLWLTGSMCVREAPDPTCP